MLISTSECFKDISCSLHEIVRKIILLLLMVYVKNTSQKVKTEQILKACACHLSFALVLHENALVFSHSQARNFLWFIIIFEFAAN